MTRRSPTFASIDDLLPVARRYHEQVASALKQCAGTVSMSGSITTPGRAFDLSTEAYMGPWDDVPEEMKHAKLANVGGIIDALEDEGFLVLDPNVAAPEDASGMIKALQSTLAATTARLRVAEQNVEELLEVLRAAKDRASRVVS